jgi:hypothetical protein
MPRLIEIEPGRWRIARERGPVACSHLPMPYLICDEMPPTEQVDGRFYTSKAKFRAVGRAHGLTEVGNEKPKPKQRASNDQAVKAARRETLQRATARYRAGERPRQNR